MRRIGVLVLVACGVAVTPGAAHAAACERSPGPPRFTVEKRERAVVVCDWMKGTRRVVRRVAAPARIGRAVVVGPRVAWIEGRADAEQTLHLRHLLARAPARELDRGFIGLLRAEDGVTLSWWNDGGFRFVDFAPPPMQDGCPVRPSFRLVEEREGIRITVARHGRQFDGAQYAWRACRIGSGRDTVILTHPDTAWGNGTVVRLAGVGEGVVAFVFMSYTRYDGCEREAVVSVDADTGERLVSGADDWCGTGAAPPESARTVVVTSTGAVAWVADKVLRAVRTTGAVEVLDRGVIADVRAEGDVLRWTNAGVPREARP